MGCGPAKPAVTVAMGVAGGFGVRLAKELGSRSMPFDPRPLPAPLLTDSAGPPCLEPYTPKPNGPTPMEHR